MGNLLLVVAAVAVLIALALMRHAAVLSARRRSEGMSQVAARRGWTYTARDDSWVNRFRGRPFETGRNRTASNIVTGIHDGRKFAAFDYAHTVTELGLDGKMHTETYDYSIVAISTKIVFPHLEVTPEGLFSRMAGRVTGADIDFESEAFNRTFVVRCADRKFATDVVHPQMMEHLMTMPTLAWTLRNGTLMLVGVGQHDLRQLDGRLRIIDGIIDRIPAYVWEQADGT
jgi:hypothetical protein